MDRKPSVAVDLLRLGVMDPESALGHHQRIVERIGADPNRLAEWERHLETSCDPDLTLDVLADLSQESPLVVDLLHDDDVARRLVRLLGASSELGRHLIAHPDDLAEVARDPVRSSRDEIFGDLLAVVGAHEDGEFLVADTPTGPAADRLRLANRRHLVRIASRDVGADDPTEVVEDIAGELTDLADAVVTAALALARADCPGHADARLAIVAMGKCGAQELNYLSDVDVIHVAEPAREGVSGTRAVDIATKLAASVARICSAHSAAGSIWQLDAALRPEGNAGPLVRTMDSMRTYYEKWAKNWEFQALLKARPMAGDLHLGQRFVEMVSPMVWQVGEAEGFVPETRAMRTRVVSLIAAKEKGREIKLGAGGLRDVEFTAQLLQLVHGRHDESLRVRDTLPALRALAAGGYISRGAAERLEDAYRLERVMEHRVQMFRLRRTHLLPDDKPGLRRLARAVGLHTPDEVRGVWTATSKSVLRTHGQVFYSPVVEAVARIPTEDLRMSPEAAKVRLSALGFHDEDAGLRHIEALTSGTTRAVRIQTALMPAMLAWLADGPSPDNGLLAFRQVSEALGESPWYLRAMRDEGAMAQRLATVLSTSRYAVDVLTRAPETVQVLVDDDLTPVGRDDLIRQMNAVARRHHDVEEAVAAIRAVRRRELFRILVADILSVTDTVRIGQALTDLTGATIDAALGAVSRGVEDAPPIGIVAMGRWGGQELSYGSDADCLFVVGDGPGAGEKALRIVTTLRNLLGKNGADPALVLDADLRPEGRSGPMVRSLESYRKYYEKWSNTWESQALLRANHGAGDRDLTAALLKCVDHLRYPADGLTASQLAEIRKLKARMESERIPHGVDPRRHLKLGPGGLSDIEWTAQVLQLQYAGKEPALRTTSTIEALNAAVTAGYIDQEQHAELCDSWLAASRLRNAIMVVRGRPSDVIPSDSIDLDVIARALGMGRGASEQLIEDHFRHCRRASKVVDAVFWGQ
ncbi:bifunctional [glutamine synthetase] adenylyltransferase/[glutamine synthetase]-adenylyl-L-tyrosine phosphorylase [Cutibacterium sp.]|uniref:bifunctional [glutamine synthetase] adenylyltransferase/[glutamine synthetase]-adenylyl-L-tyrosine phosphorylase n=1 Tax=Cutibacterium sp. TaxID=1912221 RepID=UPI0026DDCCAC|nr:bifunctional [glutamine synthetase] adenylyltransferase/[glutamine synthetase]-adenylyl-L-tyrosine phosphorylase [Cutibacterium sp.]MDO4411560.1 bifunctional [glutamine synthetase] adenylyltransferase/[glutamine synthetase]-adenylyl-L-tyrosine phosphorylase [Cutibacterium sp.]